MSDEIREMIGDHDIIGYDDSRNIPLNETSILSFETQNNAETDHENLLANACDQTYFDCMDDGRYGLCWADNSNESGGRTTLASCIADPPSYPGHSGPHPVSNHASGRPSAPVLRLDTHLGQAVNGKGKGRMEETELEAEADIWKSDQGVAIEDSLEDCGALTRAEKDEQSRRDAELSLLLLAQELLEQGVPQEEVASYVFRTQAFVMPSSPAPALGSPSPSPKSSPRHCAEEKLDLGRIAQLTVDEVAKRSLPPAYGPHYNPEPSTSQAGSPILTVRRLSISSAISNNSTTSSSSAAPSSSYTLEEEDELAARMQQFLDERYEANKVEILCDLDEEARRRQKLEQGGRSRRLDMWRQRFGLGLAGGGHPEKRTSKDPQYPDLSHSSFPSALFDLPDDVRFVQGGGHNCGHEHGRDNQGSAVRTPQGPTSQRGPDQFPISYFATGDGGTLACTLSRD